MKNKIIKLIGMIMLFVMVFSFNAHASSDYGTVTVPKNSVFVIAEEDATRSGNYSNVKVRVSSVVPTDSVEDNYTKCKAVLYNQNYMMSDVKTITEGSTMYSLPVREGYLSLKYFNLCFAGNNPNYRAVVSYYYDGQ